MLLFLTKKKHIYTSIWSLIFSKSSLVGSSAVGSSAVGFSAVGSSASSLALSAASTVSLT